jgi:hypothetical protein
MNEEKLKKLGFKKIIDKNYPDLLWWEKDIKLADIKAKLSWDGKFGLLEVKVYTEICSKSKKQWETIWITRNFSKFVKRVKKYDNKL